MRLVGRFEGMVEEANVNRKVQGMDSIEKRISGLKRKLQKNASVENLQKSKGPRGSRSAGAAGENEGQDFGSKLRQSRLRALGENTHETPITGQMLDDPMNGEFWRRMQAARKRVNGRLHAETVTTQQI